MPEHTLQILPSVGFTLNVLHVTRFTQCIGLNTSADVCIQASGVECKHQEMVPEKKRIEMY